VKVTLRKRHWETGRITKRFSEWQMTISFFLLKNKVLPAYRIFKRLPQNAYLQFEVLDPALQLNYFGAVDGLGIIGFLIGKLLSYFPEKIIFQELRNLCNPVYLNGRPAKHTRNGWLVDFQGACQGRIGNVITLQFAYDHWIYWKCFHAWVRIKLNFWIKIESAPKKFPTTKTELAGACL